MWLDEKTLYIGTTDARIKEVFFDGYQTNRGNLKGFYGLLFFSAQNRSQVHQIEENSELEIEAGGELLGELEEAEIDDRKKPKLEKAITAMSRAYPDECLYRGVEFDSKNIQNDPHFESLAKTGNDVSKVLPNFHENRLVTALQNHDLRRRDFIWGNTAREKAMGYTNTSEQRKALLVYDKDYFKRAPSLEKARGYTATQGWVLKEKYRNKRGIPRDALKVLEVFSW